jgi:hypothetical protein
LADEADLAFHHDALGRVDFSGDHALDVFVAGREFVEALDLLEVLSHLRLFFFILREGLGVFLEIEFDRFVSEIVARILVEEVLEEGSFLLSEGRFVVAFEARGENIGGLGRLKIVEEGAGVARDPFFVVRPARPGNRQP